MSVSRPSVAAMTMTEPPEAIRLPEPPALRPRDGGALLMALPALGGLGSVALVASSGFSGTGAVRTRSLVAAGLFLVVTIAFVVLQVERQRRQRPAQEGMSRTDHLAQLARARAAVRAAADAQRDRALGLHPAPIFLTTGALPRHADLAVRVGTATGPLATRLDLPDPRPGQPPDPVAQRALERFVRAHGVVSGLPVAIDLTLVRELAVAGGRPAVDGFRRALICSAVAGRGPERLQVALLADPEEASAWAWLAWLPHHGSVTARDAIGPRRMIAATLAEIALDRAPGAHLLAIDLRDPARAEPVPADVTLLRAGAPLTAGATTVDVAGGRIQRAHLDVTPADLRVDSCDAPSATSLARRLSAPRAEPHGDRLLELLRSTPRTHLRVPIGVDLDGSPVHLDLREPAVGGHGPHGLVIGATGSGKSELLRTLVTGLVLTHAPEELHLVLIDFKGGATFAGLADLPHTSAMITNLADDLTLVDRMHDALGGELERRQQLLREAGDVASVRDVPSAADLGLATLLVVVDEFTELLAARPELAELFATIGRLGRSLGVHLLLASQRLDEGRLRGLESHLGFRIALRTFTAAESRAVLGGSQAHELPRRPGAGFLRTSPEELVRFQAELVSQPCRRAETDRVVPLTAAPVVGSLREVEEPPLLDRAVAAARTQAGPGRRARQIWLPPLTSSPRLADLLTDVPGSGPARLPVGLVDRPRQQRHEPLLLDLTGGAGHVAVVGAPRTGRSTLVATIVRSLAATAPPDRTRFAVLDLGSDLDGLADLPHTIQRCGRDDGDALRALVRTVASETEQRRTSRDPRAPDLYLVVDGWTTLRDRYPDVEAEITALAQDSLGVGVHLVLTASRWPDLRPSLRDVIGTRLELRLGDPLDSEHGRLAARAVPRMPGRGLTPDGQHFLTAVTR
jgi:S-DNA-T family DNA segregation ATPase FtsK/SpoIIIE